MEQNNLQQQFISCRQALFNKLYSNLNNRQRDSIYTVNGPLLVLAGAGSGKTTVLVHRIAHIIKYGNAYYNEYIPENITVTDIERLQSAVELSNTEINEILSEYIIPGDNPCPAWSVLSITFTNKAANEMKNRINSVIGEMADEIWAGTFHSICMRILRKYGDRVGYRSGFSIYDTDDVKKVVSACFKSLNIDDKLLPVKSVINQISRAKDRLMTPEEFAVEAGNDYRLSQMASVYTMYQKVLSNSNVLDFDDIIMQTVNLLANDAEIRDYYQRRFKYVCVDEFQDTNRAQYELIRLLSGNYNNLMVVGDDDQSIYKFRGATIANILNFERDFKDSKIIKLEQNYRSSKNILYTANSIIRNNITRRGKELWTDNVEGEKVYLKKAENQIDEAKFIINKIMESVIREKRKLSNFAVLYRVNAQSNSLEQIFAKSGIAYRIVGGVRFYERKEIKDIMSYLHVINNTDDNLRLKRIINEPKRKIGDATVNSIDQLAIENNTSMFKIMENSDKFPLIAKSAYRLKDFTNIIKGLQEIAEFEKLSVLIDKTIDLTGYREMLVAGGEMEHDRLENVQELITNAIEFENNREEVTLNAFLEEIALVADIDNYDTDAEAVTLMTIHSAKGLEFPVVFLPGWEDGLFPSIQSAMDPDELEEERRLAYVAVTRAKEKLYSIHVRERLLYGRTQYNQVSRFIGEIPEEFLEIDEPKKVVVEKDKDGKKKNKNVISKEFYKKSDLSNNIGKTVGFEKFNEGDQVSHITFGVGEILSVSEMGSDILYEIAFEDIGTKRLMATYAKLKKI